jgi:hypothetical protein
MEADFNFLCAF